MKNFAKVSILILLAVFFLAGSATATPVAVNGDELQTVLNRWGLDDEDDQIDMPKGWGLTNASSASNMTFYHENPEGMSFGIYSTEGLEEATVFNGGSTPVAKATVGFQDDNTVVLNYYDADGYLLNPNPVFKAFTGTSFGFWISNGTQTFYSDAERNDGDVRILAYKADPGSYVFAGDMEGNGTFANIVTQAESIKPVPEPATLVLMGLGLFGLAGFGRKKYKK